MVKLKGNILYDSKKCLMKIKHLCCQLKCDDSLEGKSLILVLLATSVI